MYMRKINTDKVNMVWQKNKKLLVENVIGVIM